MVIASLMIPLHVHLVPDCLSFLQIGESCAQIRFGQIKHYHGHNFADIREFSGLTVVYSSCDLVDKLLDDLLTSLRITEVRSDWLFCKLLNKHVYDSIEDSRRHEEFSQLIAALWLVYKVLKCKTEVLNNSCV